MMTSRRIWIVAALLFVLTANVCLHEHYDHSCAVCAATHNSASAAQPKGPVHLMEPFAAVACRIEPQPPAGCSSPAADYSPPRAPPA